MAQTATYQAVAAGDANVLFDSWGSNPANFTFLTAPCQRSLHDASAYIERLLANPANLGFHILLGVEVVGLVKVLRDGHRAQVGYVIDQRWWGRGHATAAVRFVTERLRRESEIQRIWATCALENVPSHRVLEKAGFEKEGVLSNWVVYPEQGLGAHDNVSFVLRR